ncbi:MAG: alanine racemase, partial [Oscillospiraceae bacterium]
MYTFLRRTWAEINLDSLQYNTQLLLNSTKNKTSIMAVVKADAYGHGDKMIVNELSAAGINFFAVSNLDEALCIRKFNKECNILVLGFTPITSAKTLMEFNIHQTVFSSEYAVSLNDFCREHSLKIKAHLKLDTGMSRIGFCSSTDDEYALIKSTLGLECLDFVGIFTHLSSADTNDEESIIYTQMQMQTFNNCVLKLKNDGKTFKYIHMQNSAAIIKYDAPECNYSRACIIMY